MPYPNFANSIKTRECVRFFRLFKTSRLRTDHRNMQYRENDNSCLPKTHVMRENKGLRFYPLEAMCYFFFGFPIFPLLPLEGVGGWYKAVFNGGGLPLDNGPFNG
jgi:hypothetical protein